MNLINMTNWDQVHEFYKKVKNRKKNYFSN